MAEPMAGPDSMWTTCPNCKEEIRTRTQKSIGTFQMLVAGGLCCFGCICCFYIPCCIDDWKDVLLTYLPQLQLRHRKIQKNMMKSEGKSSEEASTSINYISI